MAWALLVGGQFVRQALDACPHEAVRRLDIDPEELRDARGADLDAPGVEFAGRHGNPVRAEYAYLDSEHAPVAGVHVAIAALIAGPERYAANHPQERLVVVVARL